MARKDDTRRGLSRREFLESTGLTTLALSTGTLTGISATATASQGTAQAAAPAGNAPFADPARQREASTEKKAIARARGGTGLQ